LEFLGVGFQYPGRSQPALRDITFSLERGECVAVVGPSGAGKSTLAQLLLRFWEYDTGEIRLRGTSIRSVDADLVRAQIGFASQDPYMFDTSILENLRLARRGVQLADLELAARRAAIADFIHSLPNGFQTCIGEHGATLSTGERQRLGIARLILKDAPLLLLDEPTANLDALTEGLILDSLWELSRGRTCLFITHRLLRMERFDRVLVMANGLIREHGSHRSLIDAGGVYARMWAMQDGSERLPENGLANGK
jgi:ABC-type multidrug transport system fused ATPase/permease subunit